MSKFKHHKYVYANRFAPAHHWELVGPIGGIHFHFHVLKGFPVTAGLEFHHTGRSQRQIDRAPDHISCSLTGEPCWHEGTSLYATEDILPVVLPLLERGDHDGVFRILEIEYEQHFEAEAV